MSEFTVLKEQIADLSGKVDKILQKLETLVRVEERQNSQADRISRIEGVAADHDRRLRDLELSQQNDTAKDSTRTAIASAVWPIIAALLTAALMYWFDRAPHTPRVEALPARPEQK